MEDQVASLVEQQLRAALHEMRQPLAAVFALAEMARSIPGLDEDVRGCLDLIIDQAREVAAAAVSVLASPPHTLESPEADLDEIVDSVVDCFRLTWTGTLSRVGDRAGPPVRGRRAEIRRSLVNVVENAVCAAGPHGSVRVSVHPGSGFWRVAVEDDGPGFGRVAARTGLGLDLARDTLSSLGGRLSIGRPLTMRGARVVLDFPYVRTGFPEPASVVRAV